MFWLFGVIILVLAVHNECVRTFLFMFLFLFLFLLLLLWVVMVMVAVVVVLMGQRSCSRWDKARRGTL